MGFLDKSGFWYFLKGCRRITCQKYTLTFPRILHEMGFLNKKGFWYFHKNDSAIVLAFLYQE